MIFPLPAPQRDPRRSHRANTVRRLRRRVPERPWTPPEELISGLLQLHDRQRMDALAMIKEQQGEERATLVVVALTERIKREKGFA